MISKEFQIGLLHKCLDLDFWLCDSTELSKFFYGMFSPYSKGVMVEEICAAHLEIHNLTWPSFLL